MRKDVNWDFHFDRPISTRRYDKRPTTTGRAKAYLAQFSAEMVCGDASIYDTGEADAIHINAGTTHPVALWFSLVNVSTLGRLPFPVCKLGSHPIWKCFRCRGSLRAMKPMSSRCHISLRHAHPDEPI